MGTALQSGQWLLRVRGSNLISGAQLTDCLCGEGWTDGRWDWERSDGLESATVQSSVPLRVR